MRSLRLTALLVLTLGVSTTGCNDLRGQAGQNGADGAPGPAGPQGPAGMNGADGAMGFNGVAGPQGPKGDPGTPGGTPAMFVNKWAVSTRDNTDGQRQRSYLIATDGNGNYKVGAGVDLNLGANGGSPPSSHGHIACGKDTAVATNYASNSITLSKKDADGKYTISQTISVANGPRATICDDNGSRLYVLTGDAFEYHTLLGDGKFDATAASTQPLMRRDNTAADIVLAKHPMGDYIVVTERGNDLAVIGEGESAIKGNGRVEIFTLNFMTGYPTGERRNVPLKNGQTPLGMAVAKNGKVIITIAHRKPSQVLFVDPYTATVIFTVDTFGTSNDGTSDETGVSDNTAACWAAVLESGSILVTITRGKRLDWYWNDASTLNLIPATFNTADDKVGGNPTDIAGFGSITAFIVKGATTDYIYLFEETMTGFKRLVPPISLGFKTATGIAIQAL